MQGFCRRLLQQDGPAQSESEYVERCKVVRIVPKLYRDSTRIVSDHKNARETSILWMGMQSTVDPF